MTMTTGGLPPGPGLSARFGSAGRWLTVELRGELNKVTAAALLDRIGLLIAQEIPPRIALELSRVSSCDSSGISMFIRLWKRAVAAGGELVLLRPAGQLAEVLARTRLGSPLRAVDSLPGGSAGRPAAG